MEYTALLVFSIPKYGVPFLSMPGWTSITYEYGLAPDERILFILSESRTLDIFNENRVKTIRGESRAVYIPSENRAEVILGESRSFKIKR
jgi:hypothetical protein